MKPEFSIQFIVYYIRSFLALVWLALGVVLYLVYLFAWLILAAAIALVGEYLWGGVNYEPYRVLVGVGATLIGLFVWGLLHRLFRLGYFVDTAKDSWLRLFSALGGD